MTGHGGWPLNVFCTPDQVPFFAGTYFPPTPRQGMPAWPQVLEAIAEAWHTRRDEIRRAGRRDHRAPGRHGAAGALGRADPGGRRSTRRSTPCAASTTRSRAASAARRSSRPPPCSRFLLAHGEREMSLQTLRSMAGGGINDQIGGGFARYAVDSTWTVPHFEKMLYDNALLARAYLHGWLVSGDPRAAPDVRGDARVRPARAARPGGRLVLRASTPTPRARRASSTSGRSTTSSTRSSPPTPRRRSSGSAPPRRATSRARTSSSPAVRSPPPEQRARIRERLMEVRAQRVRPGLDDKRLLAWNALALGTLAEAGARLGREDLLDAARANAEFLLGTMRDDDGPAAAHVGRDDGEAQRLPRGPRVPARGAARPLRGDVRAALVRRRARDRRHDDRALRRSRARRLLLHLRRPRAARHAAQGPRGQPDPLGLVERGARPPAPGRAHRRGDVRAPRALGARARAASSRRAIRRRSATCCSALAFAPAPAARGRARRRRAARRSSA